jgi:hypothetical protein
MGFVKGKSGNPHGRPKGILDKRLRLNKALMADGSKLLEVTKAKALEGDMTAMSLLLPRIMPVLRPEGTPVLFELNATLPTSRQIESVVQAMADGLITVDQAKQVAEMIRVMAEARAAEGGGENRDRLIEAFRSMAESGMDSSVPYTPPSTLTPPVSVTPTAAPTPPPPPTAPGDRHQLAVKRPWEK